MSAKPQTVLKLFRDGSDTYEIAKKMNLSEATVSRLVWVARCHESRLPATFLGRDRRVKLIGPADLT